MEPVRPDINIELSSADRLVEGLGIALLALLWGAATYLFFTLPAIIPTHYNFKNQVDGHGSKAVLWILPFVGTFLYVLLTVVSKYPQSFNYAVKITNENAARQYKLAVRLLRALKCLIVLMFSAFVFEMGSQNPLPMWSELLFLLPIMATIIFYMVRSIKK